MHVRNWCRAHEPHRDRHAGAEEATSRAVAALLTVLLLLDRVLAELRARPDARTPEAGSRTCVAASRRQGQWAVGVAAGLVGVVEAAAVQCGSRVRVSPEQSLRLGRLTGALGAKHVA